VGNIRVEKAKVSIIVKVIKKDGVTYYADNPQLVYYGILDDPFWLGDKVNVEEWTKRPDCHEPFQHKIDRIKVIGQAWRQRLLTDTNTTKLLKEALHYGTIYDSDKGATIESAVNNIFKEICNSPHGDTAISQSLLSADSNTAFLAMQFDDKQKAFFEKELAPCFTESGLELKVLPDFMSGENILDNKLRDAIRVSRLLVCDLTHRNNGAYFEAGFAEGLGKPVIYVCEQSSFEKRNKNFLFKIQRRFWRIHFDVRNQETYFWKNGNDKSIKKFQSDMTAKIQKVLSVKT